MTILAIDPGTLRMGYGVVADGPTLEAVDYGVIALPSSMAIESRLYQMYTHVHNLIAIFQPKAVAIEDPFVGQGERSFPKASLAIGQAQAVVFVSAAGLGIEIFKYAPGPGQTSSGRPWRRDKGAGTRDRNFHVRASTHAGVGCFGRPCRRTVSPVAAAGGWGHPERDSSGAGKVRGPAAIHDV